MTPAVVFPDQVLGPGLPGLLLDAAHAGRLRLRAPLLPRGHRVPGAGRRRQHDPGVEHADHPEPVRHQDLLAGHQVQGHRGKRFFIQPDITMRFTCSGTFFYDLNVCMKKRRSCDSDYQSVT